MLAKPVRWALPVLAGAVVIVGVAVGLVSTLGAGIGELESAPFVSSEASPSLLMRTDAWARTAEIISDHPLGGTGLGTFEWVFAQYQRRGEWLTWEQAHNDYLQLLAEAGLVGGMLFAWAFVVFIVYILRPALKVALREPRWTTLAAASAVFAMMLHSVVDFNLQIPATAVLFSVLLGVLAAASQDAVPGGAER